MAFQMHVVDLAPVRLRCLTFGVYLEYRYTIPMRNTRGTVRPSGVPGGGSPAHTRANPRRLIALAPLRVLSAYNNPYFASPQGRDRRAWAHLIKARGRHVNCSIIQSTFANTQ